MAFKDRSCLKNHRANYIPGEGGVLFCTLCKMLRPGVTPVPGTQRAQDPAARPDPAPTEGGPGGTDSDGPGDMLEG
jgi:hypothetical protein